MKTIHPFKIARLRRLLRNIQVLNLQHIAAKEYFGVEKYIRQGMSRS